VKRPQAVSRRVSEANTTIRHSVVGGRVSEANGQANATVGRSVAGGRVSEANGQERVAG
jgi:hypothetical protein